MGEGKAIYLTSIYLFHSLLRYFLIIWAITAESSPQSGRGFAESCACVLVCLCACLLGCLVCLRGQVLLYFVCFGLLNCELLCSRALHACLFMYLRVWRAWRACMLAYLLALHAYLLPCLACLFNSYFLRVSVRPCLLCLFVLFDLYFNI